VEKWKSIPGFDYEVSNLGRVRSLPRKLPTGGEKGLRSVQGQLLKGRSNQRGHIRVDRSNNAASNLEWCDRESLVKCTLKSGRLTALVSPKRAKRLNIQTVALIYELRLAGMRLSEIAMALDIRADAATNVCNGKAWQDASRPSLARTQTRAQK
jgi:hypothetical protein